MSDLVRVSHLNAGTLWRVTFGTPPGNILDLATMAALADVFRKAAADRALKGICLEGAGAHFSYGASIEEHLPDKVEAMLAGMRELALALLDGDVVVTAAVRGRCLGGGLELVSLCHRVFASSDATLGQPEIALGVFAPVASISLPGRIGRARAEEVCLTGRTFSASEARQVGLVDEIATEPAEAAVAWMRAHLANRSASSLRLAVRAIRTDLAARLREDLPKLETLYLNELMKTADATEGLKAFLEKRRAVWKDGT
jgi:cyclohexa-1,5-dienecarbonyl-CoA hydratase